MSRTRENVKDQNVSTALTAADKNEILEIASKQERTSSWLISTLVRKALEDPEMKKWLHSNPAAPMPLAVSISPIARSALTVLAWACHRTPNQVAADIVRAALTHNQLLIANVKDAAQAALATNPNDPDALRILKSAPASVPAPRQAPRPDALDAPLVPTVEVQPTTPGEPEPELELTAEPSGDGNLVFDLNHLAPADSTPSQKIVTSVAGKERIEP